MKRFCSFPALIAAAGAALCADFQNGLESMTVETPQGKFECINGKATGHRQVLRLAGRTLFEEVPSPQGITEDATLRHGIEHQNTGCPWVVAANQGFVVIGRDLQPPSYGVQGYAVIDFNKPEPSLTPLASGQRPDDMKIAASRRIDWTRGSLTLRVFGYAPDTECCTAGSPKPAALRVRYTYEGGRVEVMK